MIRINSLSVQPGVVHRKTQFEIHDLETVLPDLVNGNYPSSCDEGYSMIWIQHGIGEMNIDMGRLKIDKDTIYYLKPRQSFSLNANGNLKGFVISFTKEFLELHDIKSPGFIAIHPIGTLPMIRLKSEKIGLMKGLASAMLQEFKSFLDLRLEILKGFLKIFLMYISRQFETTAQNNCASRKVELTNAFHAQVEKNFAAKKLVREYADILSVTPNYLNYIVKEVTGSPASYHIQQRIVLEAKRKAIFEGSNMKQIAYCLGFWDPAHFSKYFKNSSGINFTDFKKEHSNFC